jgi:hypothetical protein
MNFFKNIKILFDSTKSKISYHFFTKLLPLSISGFSLHYIYKYKLYDFKNHVFTVTEGIYQRLIRKKHWKENLSLNKV